MKRCHRPPGKASLMKRKLSVGAITTLLMSLAVATPAQAAAPAEIMPADPLAGFTQFKGDPSPQTQIVPVAHSDFTEALQITTTATPASSGLDGEYEIAIGAEIAAEVHQGDA